MEKEIYNSLMDLLDKAAKEDRITNIECETESNPGHTDHNGNIVFEPGMTTIKITMKDEPCQTDH